LVGLETGCPAGLWVGTARVVPANGASGWQAARRRENTRKRDRMVSVRFKISSKESRIKKRTCPLEQVRWSIGMLIKNGLPRPRGHVRHVGRIIWIFLDYARAVSVFFSGFQHSEISYHQLVAAVSAPGGRFVISSTRC
jgi:hypothetical protein